MPTYFSNLGGSTAVVPVQTDIELINLNIDSVKNKSSWTADSGQAYKNVSVSKTNFTSDNIKAGIEILGITGTYSGERINLQSKTRDPSKDTIVVIPDEGYNGLSKVTINPIPNSYIIPSGTLDITSNEKNIDVKQYSKVNVNVSGGGGGTISLTTLNATQNNTYIPPANTAYNKVVVSVPITGDGYLMIRDTVNNTGKNLGYVRSETSGNTINFILNENI